MPISGRLGLIPLLAGALTIAVSAPAVALASGGVTIRLTCGSASGSATFTVTANRASSSATVPCGGSATVSNPAWQAFTPATIALPTVPSRMYVFEFNDQVTLSTAPVAVLEDLAPCPASTRSGTVPGGCPPANLGPAYLRLLGAYVVVFVIVLVLMLAVLTPFEFWTIRGYIRFFSRKEDPHQVIDDLAARPALGWWVRRYVDYVRLKHRLFRVPLPPGF